MCMDFAESSTSMDAIFHAKCTTKNTNAHTEGLMDKYDVIGLVIAILAVSVVLLH